MKATDVIFIRNYFQATEKYCRDLKKVLTKAIENDASWQLEEETVLRSLKVLAERALKNAEAIKSKPVETVADRAIRDAKAGKQISVLDLVNKTPVTAAEN